MGVGVGVGVGGEGRWGGWGGGGGTERIEDSEGSECNLGGRGERKEEEEEEEEEEEKNTWLLTHLTGLTHSLTRRAHSVGSLTHHLRLQSLIVSVAVTTTTTTTTTTSSMTTTTAAPAAAAQLVCFQAYNNATCGVAYGAPQCALETHCTHTDNSGGVDESTLQTCHNGYVQISLYRNSSSCRPDKLVYAFNSSISGCQNLGGYPGYLSCGKCEWW